MMPSNNKTGRSSDYLNYLRDEVNETAQEVKVAISNGTVMTYLAFAEKVQSYKDEALERLTRGTGKTQASKRRLTPGNVDSELTIFAARSRRNQKREEMEVLSLSEKAANMKATAISAIVNAKEKGLEMANSLIASGMQRIQNRIK